MSGNGTGSPAWFMCWACRRRRGSSPGIRPPVTVTLTGRTRPRRHRVGARSTMVDREYRCRCGHVGWSNHSDLERLARSALFS